MRHSTFYRTVKDVPNAEVHVVDAGYFALDTKADEIAELVRDFHERVCQKSGVRIAHEYKLEFSRLAEIDNTAGG